MNIGGYSTASKERAKEQIEDLKEQSKQEIFIRKQKIKQLSTQTNKIRRKLEESKKNQEDEEEKRRLRILKMRKIKQDSATEKFQRTPDKKKRDQHNIDTQNNNMTGLQDGNYNVGNHVIEIRDGKRVHSSRSNHDDNQNHMIHNSKFQNNLYNPTSYLNDHVRDLFNSDTGPIITDQYLDSAPPLTTMNHQEFNSGPPKSPTDSLCSNDSLLSNESPSNKMLRSSLKSSNMKMTDSQIRKVTFSDSVEFNDGETQPIFTTTVATRVPLYKRIEQKQQNNSPNVHPTPSRVIDLKDDIPTTEQLLDQLRQQALLPKYPQNEDFSYPFSVETSQPVTSTVSTHSTHITKTEYKDEAVNKSFVDSLSADSLSVASVEDSIELDDEQKEAVSTQKVVTSNTASTYQHSSYVIPTHTPVTFVPRKAQVAMTTSSIQSHTPNVITRPDNMYKTKQKYTSFRNAEYEKKKDLHNSNPMEKNEIQSISSDVIKIHSDTVHPYLSNIVKNSNINIETDVKITETDSKNHFSSDLDVSAYHDEFTYREPDNILDNSNHGEDTVFKDIQASLAGVTFENISQQYTNQNEANIIRRPMNKPKGDLDIDQPQDYPESKRINSAIKDGTSIPVRVHSSNVRRGRIIVSANEKKRRQIGNFTPHPPPKTKCNEEEKKSTGSSKVISSPRFLPPKSKPVPKTNTNTRHQTIQAYSSPRQKPVAKNQSKPNSPRVKTQTNKYRSPVSSPRVRSAGSVAKPSKTPQHQPSSHQSVTNYPTQNFDPYHTYERTPSHGYTPTNNNNNDKSRKMSLDKTPTDDEINTLWQNVRDCLGSDVQEHAYSDTACHVEHRTYHQRTLSGSLIRRSNNYPHPVNTRNYISNNKRYGSHESLNRPSSNDSFSSNASSFTKRQALLTQRTSRILSPKLVTDTNNNSTYFRRKTMNSKQNALNKKKNHHVEVSESMAAFLALEELCNEQSLTPSQTEAVFKASKSLIRKQNSEVLPSQKGMSALSMEEERVMKSLDRINEKLKRQDEIQKTMISKRR